MIRQVMALLRSFVRRPSFLAATVLPLACGLGAAVAVFSLVQHLLMGPLGLPEADRVLAVSQNLPELGGAAPMSAASILAIAEHQSSFQSLASLQVTDRTLTERGEPVRVKVASVTPSFFVLGATRPALGRLFNADDGLLTSAQTMIFGNGSVAILTDSLWKSRFGADPTVVGKSLVLDGRWYQIVGVMPPEFQYPLAAQLWIPLGFGGIAPQDFGGFYFQTIARLKPGAGVDKASSDLARIAAVLRPAAPKITRGLTFEVESLRERLVGDRRTSMLLLFGLTLVIVLGVSANTAQILLARILARQRDLALRLVLGASQGEVTGLVLAEGLVLALLGWGLGVALAWLTLSFFGRVLPQHPLGLLSLGLNGPVVAFSLGIALASGLILGFVPALAMRRRSLLTHLREGAIQSSPGPRQRRLHRLLLVTQLGLALVLIASGTLLYASFARLQSVHLGFNPASLATIDLKLPNESYDPARLRSFTSQAVEALRGIPGVSAAAAGLRLPVLDPGGGIWFSLPEHHELATKNQVAATFNTVTPGFFSTLRIPLLAGRDFAAQDRTGGEPVAIIDQVLARQFFGSENPIGRPLVLTPWPDVRRRIIGVVGAVKFGGLKGEPVPTVYVPEDQVPLGQVRLVVRSQGPLAAALDAARKRIWGIDPHLAFDAFGTYEDRIEVLSTPDRWALRLVLALGLLGLVLSGSCIYAMTTQLVSQRFRELGIRLALGSPPSRVVRQVISERLPDVVAGLILGLGGVWMIGRWAGSSVLFEVSAQDPLLLGVSVVILAGAALLALLLPAWRAARIDPMTILR